MKFLILVFLQLLISKVSNGQKVENIKLGCSPKTEKNSVLKQIGSEKFKDFSDLGLSWSFIGTQKIIATYGDGLANVNINSLLHKHTQSELLATVTAVRPPARFGVLESSNGVVTHFGEKNQADAGWINGGFFVFNKENKGKCTRKTG